MFGQAVTVYYRGKDRYRTKIGALMTIAVIAVLSAIIVFRF
jgi:hypothetical protein